MIFLRKLQKYKVKRKWKLTVEGDGKNDKKTKSLSFQNFFGFELQESLPWERI